MPKLKTRRSAKKRFSKTKSGKFKYRKANRRHLLETTTPKKSRKLKGSSYIGKEDQWHVDQMMPYA